MYVCCVTYHKYQAEIVAARFGPVQHHDTHAEFEIKVTASHYQWFVYRQYKHFQELDRALKQQAKDFTLEKPLSFSALPSIPTRSKYDIEAVVESKDALNKYVQFFMNDSALRNYDHVKAFLGWFDDDDIPKLFFFPDLISFAYGKDKRVSVELSCFFFFETLLDLEENEEGQQQQQQLQKKRYWTAGDNSLVFDEAHLIELRFSAKDVPIKNRHGCCLRIYEPNEPKQGIRFYDCLPQRRLLMQTEYVIDHSDPHFQKILLLDYVPMNFSILQVDLCLDEDDQQPPIGTAVFELAHVMCERTGCVVHSVSSIFFIFIFLLEDTKKKTTTANKRDNASVLVPTKALGKRASSLPEPQKNSTNDTANEFPRIDKTTIAMTVRRFVSLEDKTLSPNFVLDQNDIRIQTTQTNHSKYPTDSAQQQTRPFKTLPSNMRCEKWSVELQHNLKSILNAHSNLRISVAAKADKLTMDYFIYKDNDQMYEVCDLLLEVWRRVLEEIDTMIINEAKSSVLSKLCDIIFGIMTRYEWDLTHIKHWVYHDKYQPVTSPTWNKKMHRYHKQLELTIVEKKYISKNNNTLFFFFFSPSLSSSFPLIF
ncbi:hypothetical protein RFI_39209 [Reticulomyxa filosa]|uniref:PX domain-containing protein n=1 Tax=Reticulomyxa filosa TaxID=46433 RepID=X6LAB7_RETFI|nr:hypothetical protein RFI_39209 [Reticulomyxa filosa]|eukprot:ETN98300.1 hypothetical protein RFI_39209 [Reticulomyxa filosa]